MVKYVFVLIKGKTLGGKMKQIIHQIGVIGLLICIGVMTIGCGRLHENPTLKTTPEEPVMLQHKKFSSEENKNIIITDIKSPNSIIQLAQYSEGENEDVLLGIIKQISPYLSHTNIAYQKAALIGMSLLGRDATHNINARCLGYILAQNIQDDEVQLVKIKVISKLLSQNQNKSLYKESVQFLKECYEKESAVVATKAAYYWASLIQYDSTMLSNLKDNLSKETRLNVKTQLIKSVITTGIMLPDMNSEILKLLSNLYDDKKMIELRPLIRHGIESFKNQKK